MNTITKRDLAVGFAAAATVLGTSSLASSVSIPNSFTAGTAIKAAEVNANFSALATGINDNNANIIGNTGDFVDVDCSVSPGALQAAIDARTKHPTKAWEFTIIGGTCSRVQIAERSNLQIHGGGFSIDGGTAGPAIELLRSHNVLVDNVTLLSSHFNGALLATGGSSVLLKNLTVAPATGANVGVAIKGGSLLRVEGPATLNEGDSLVAIEVADGSFLRLTDASGSYSIGGIKVRNGSSFSDDEDTGTLSPLGALTVERNSSAVLHSVSNMPSVNVAENSAVSLYLRTDAAAPTDPLAVAVKGNSRLTVDHYPLGGGAVKVEAGSSANFYNNSTINTMTIGTVTVDAESSVNFHNDSADFPMSTGALAIRGNSQVTLDSVSVNGNVNVERNSNLHVFAQSTIGGTGLTALIELNSSVRLDEEAPPGGGGNVTPVWAMPTSATTLRFNSSFFSPKDVGPLSGAFACTDPGGGQSSVARDANSLGNTEDLCPLG